MFWENDRLRVKGIFGRLVYAIVAAVAAQGLAAPAWAEQLNFDHRLYQPLQQSLDSGRKELLRFDGRNPAYLVDMVVVRGESVRNWTEALVIIARSPDAKVRDSADWLAELRRQAEARCPSDFIVIAQDEISLTVERNSHGCAADYPASAFYRIVKGKSSLFLLGAMSKDGFTAEARQGWLSLFASAHLS